MAIGSFGNIRSADVDPSDVEIFYHFTSDRTESPQIKRLKKLSSTNILTPILYGDINEGVDSEVISGNEILGGLYNLTLDSSEFSDLGIYTLYLRPKQIRCKISDCGILSSLPSVRGIVIDLSTISDEDVYRFTPQNLIGYRIEYLDTENGEKVKNFYKIITSSFYCEPIISNLTNVAEKAIRYRYTDQITNLMFLTVTPSSSPSNRPNTIPFIGQPDQKIILTNTFFNPLTIEVEMVEHDETTLAHALYGNQSKAIESGIYTIYDKDNNIYKQYNLYEIKDEFNETLYEIREERDNIDETLNLDIITEIE